MLKSFVHVLAESPGFQSGDVLTVLVAIPEAKYPEPYQQSAFYEELEQRIESLPGVQSVSSTQPLLWGSNYYFVIDGRPTPEPGSRWVTDGLVVSPDYFRTMEIPLLQGRLFTEADRADTPRVAIIDQKFAETYWPGDDPVGKRVKLSGNPDSTRPWLEIIGVVGHVKNLGVDQDSTVAIYRPHFQEPERYMTVLVKTSTPPETMAAAVRQEVARLDADQPVYRVRTLEQHVSNWMMPRRVSSVLLAIFSTIALVMAAVGIYGLMAYAVSRRTQEIGIRMAMGAKAQDILKLVMGETTRLAAMGVGIGLAAALLVTPLMASLLFGVRPRDPLTFVGIALVLSAVVLVAAVLPARRAARVEPLEALHYE
jgi:putative ABC transport system permease protein